MCILKSELFLRKNVDSTINLWMRLSIMRSINFEKQEWDWSVVGYQIIFSSFKNWFYPCHFIGEDSRCSRDIKNMFQNNKYLIGHFLTKSADTSSYPGVLLLWGTQMHFPVLKPYDWWYWAKGSWNEYTVKPPNDGHALDGGQNI